MRRTAAELHPDMITLNRSSSARVTWVSRSVGLCVVALLSACASAPPRWFLDGKTQADLDGAHVYCSNSAASSMNGQNLNQGGQFVGGSSGPAGPGLAGLGLLMVALEAGAANHHYRQCMRAQGFRPV